MLLTVLTENVPRTTGGECTELGKLNDGFFRGVLHYGYMPKADVPSERATRKARGLEIDLKGATCHIEHQAPVSGQGGSTAWRAGATACSAC